MPIIKVHYRDTPKEDLRNITVPQRELDILLLLEDEELIVPQIEKKQEEDCENKLTLAAIYSLIKRLRGKGLVTRNILEITTCGTIYRRVVYKRTFDTLEKII